MGVSPLSSLRRTQNASTTKPTLRPGSKGAAVTTLQNNLHKHGYGATAGRADGDYGPKTKAAVTAFQNDRITALGGRIKNASTDSEAIRLSQERNGLVRERDAGVAGDVTQSQLAAAASTTAPSTSASPTSGAPTPNLPPRDATTAVGGDPSITAPATQPTGAPATAPQTSSGLSNNTYTVKSGDTMGKIAQDHNMTLGTLTRANPQVSDPNKIAVGQKLNIPTTAAPSASPTPAEIDRQSGVSYDDPAPAAPTTVASPSPAEIDRQNGVSYDDLAAASSYTVKSGDTMGGIARDHDITLGELVSANPQVSDPNKIAVGQKLNLPAQAPAPTSPSTTTAPPAPAEIDRQSGVSYDDPAPGATSGAPIGDTPPGVLTLPEHLTPGTAPRSFDATMANKNGAFNVNVQASNVSQPESAASGHVPWTSPKRVSPNRTKGATLAPLGRKGASLMATP